MKFQVNVIEPISLNASDEKNLIHFIKSKFSDLLNLQKSSSVLGVLRH